MEASASGLQAYATKMSEETSLDYNSFAKIQ
jgi:hypothetical protein